MAKEHNISKNFTDDEILYKSDGILYLKEGVKRNPKAFKNTYDETIESATYINYPLIWMEKSQKLRQLLDGEDNTESND